ncbi:MAG: hypothetical protein INQ03_07330 [Candidatus Heimdallarchaeota archaeon]|nr:hypothetical protein [Candidatus Heimdallarchaeota archaeon]
MAELKFYKVDKRKGLVLVDNSAKSLHHRRSIVIVDPNNEVLWILNGSNIDENLISLADKKAEELNKEYNFPIIDELNIKHTKLVSQLLDNQNLRHLIPNNKVIKAPVSNREIPKTPKLPSINRNDHILLGDVDHQGPLIEEFQIAYFEDGTVEKVDSKNYLMYSIQFLELIDAFANSSLSSKDFKQKSYDLIDDIIRD